jgi:two-component system sensor histidine kinase UhpB
MVARRSHREGGYVPLVYRVGAVNAVVLAVAVILTIVVLAPKKFSSVASDEAAVLIGALVVVGVVNLLVLERVVRPLEVVTELARRVDLTRPGERIPHAAATSEAGVLALAFNEMLARLEDERRDATGRVLAGQEAERLRIAQELHDQVGQELTAVLLGLARVHAQLQPPLRDSLGEVQEAVRSSLESVRRIALELRPEALDDLGLVSALAVLGERFAERSGLVVDQHFDEQLPVVDPDCELVVYRVAQEALTNVARHAGVTHASVDLRHHDGGALLTVRDSGHGIGENVKPGAGIRGMRERAALIGGKLDIGSGPDGRGCEVTLTVPDAARVIPA